MYAIKKTIYTDLSKPQKNALCNYLRAFTKKNPSCPVSELWEKFFEDEEYYLNVNNSNFPFLADLIYDEKFKSDTIKFLNECKKYYDYKEKQRPIIDAQKEFEKKKRKFLQEVKMSKESPTKKQLYYYEKLCKNHNIEPKELTSKLQARDEIDAILKKYSHAEDE